MQPTNPINPVKPTKEYRASILYSVFAVLLLTFGSVGMYIKAQSYDLQSSKPLWGLIAGVLVMLLMIASKKIQSKISNKVLKSIFGIFIFLIFISVSAFFYDALYALFAGIIAPLTVYYAWIGIVTKKPMITATSEYLAVHNSPLYAGQNFTIAWDNVKDMWLLCQRARGLGVTRYFLAIKLIDPTAYKEQTKGGFGLGALMRLGNKYAGSDAQVCISHLDSNVNDVFNELSGYAKNLKTTNNT